MDYAKFQVAVVEVAHAGVPLTVANVVARLRLDPEEAERKLDRMAKEGRLDLEVDEDEGVVVYRVRGLSPKSVSEKLEGLRSKVESEAMQHVGTALSFGKPFQKGSPLPVSLRRSIPAGVVLGGLFPGIGLAYAAPWSVVAVATIAVIVGFKILSFVWLGVPFLMIACLASAAAGAAYTWRYNQTGKRTALLEEEQRRRLARWRNSCTCPCPCPNRSTSTSTSTSGPRSQAVFVFVFLDGHGHGHVHGHDYPSYPCALKS